MSLRSELIALVDDLGLLAEVRGDTHARTEWTAIRAAILEAGAVEHVAPVTRATIETFESTGWVLREQAIAELPVDLRWLFEAGAVTLAQLEPLTRTLGAVTLADLYDLVARHAIAGHSSLGPAVERSVEQSLPMLRARVPRIAIGRALTVAEPILQHLRTVPGTQTPHLAGSLRRGYDLIGDIDIVFGTTQVDDVLDAIAERDEVEQVAFRSARRLVVNIGHTQVAVRCPEPEAAAATLLCATGHRLHVDRLQQIAHDRQLMLTPGGLASASGRGRAHESEEAIYAALGLPWIPPELREGRDEIERARAGALPDLVQREDIAGDLHMHTTWSDGRDSVEAMVEAAVALGYRYIAITDHSASSDAVKNLMPEDIGRQAEEIARARERFPQIAVLHGCEVDILADGRLNFPDKTLRRFDIVLASLHDRAGHSRQELMRRYLSAMLHPLVTVITHPTNRLFPRRQGYDLDYDRLFEAATETRTIVEIDGAPSHIDLDATLAARAIAMGATVSIDSDSHAANQLARHMQIGVATARRGGVERKHVLNTRPLPEIKALISSKRSRFPA